MVSSNALWQLATSACAAGNIQYSFRDANQESRNITPLELTHFNSNAVRIRSRRPSELRLERITPIGGKGVKDGDLQHSGIQSRTERICDRKNVILWLLAFDSRLIEYFFVRRQTESGETQLWRDVRPGWGGRLGLIGKVCARISWSPVVRWYWISNGGSHEELR